MSRILVVAAHHDDEVLGAGGFMKKMSEEGHDIHVLICSHKRMGGVLLEDAALSEYDEMAKSAGELCGACQVSFTRFPDEDYPIHLYELKNVIEAVSSSIEPDVVVTHSQKDINQDHRAVHEACTIAFRPWPSVRAPLFMQVMSSTKPAFTPSYIVGLSQDHIQSKLLALSKYSVEMREYPHPRSSRSITAQAQHIGSQFGMLYAEGFEVGFMKGTIDG